MDQVDIAESLLPSSVCVELTLLPAQFHDLFYRRHDDSPERNLLVAVLADALHCWLFHPPNTTYPAHRSGIPYRVRLQREAGEWLLGDSRKAPFSFEFVCQALGLDADVIRERLRKYPNLEGSSRKPWPNRRSPVITKGRYVAV